MKSNQFDKIKCPECKTLIPLTETLQHQLTESIRKKYEEEFTKKEKKLVQKERDLDLKNKSLKKEVDKNVKDRLDIEKKSLSRKVTKEIKEKYSLQVKYLQDDLKSKKKELEEANKKELELLKQKRQLEEKEKNIDLEIARKIETERKQIENNTEERILDRNRMIFADKDKTINDLKKLSEDLKRKAEQGSQQMQGEIQELELKKDLSNFFHLDNIQSIPKGVRGADVIQKVLSKSGKLCGTMIYESKRTKKWSDKWISTLKKERQKAKADIAIIVTQALPKDITSFGLLKGIWITDYSNFLNLAFILRENMIKIASTKEMARVTDQKSQILFRYLTGSEFYQRIEAIIEAYSDMKQDLDKEKRSYERLWSKREKQLQLALENTAYMFGDFQGMVGSSMKTIPALSELEILDKENIEKKEFTDKGSEDNEEDEE